jgi:hypothetical protein
VRSALLYLAGESLVLVDYYKFYNIMEKYSNPVFLRAEKRFPGDEESSTIP